MKSSVLFCKIRDLKRVLGVRDRGGAPCHSVRALVGERLDGLDQRIEELLTLRDELRRLVTEWDGMGMAATQSLYELFVTPSHTLGLDPMEVGAMVSTGAAAGRTMSPVAAVALMSAKLTGTNSIQLARRVAPPLIISMVIIVILRMARIL